MSPRSYYCTKGLCGGAVFQDLEREESWAFHSPGPRGVVHGAEEEAASVPLWESQSSTFSSSLMPPLLLFCFICSSSPIALPSHLCVPLLSVLILQCTPRFLCSPHYELTKRATQFPMRLPAFLQTVLLPLLVSSFAQLPSFLAALP